MEVNDSQNDRGAPERIDLIKLEQGAGSMELPVQMKSGLSMLKPESGNNRSPGKRHNRPP